MSETKSVHYGSNWTIPNLLTIIRIFITPAFVVAFFNEDYILALTLFVLAGLTDGLDGFLARVLKQRSRLGAMIDPLADKFLLLTSFVCLGVQGWIPFWLIVVVISRDLIVIGGLFVLHIFGINVKNKINPTLDSKLNTLFQIILLLVAMAAYTFDVSGLLLLTSILVFLVGFLTIFSGVRYVLLGFSFLHADMNQES
ncbi:CDP-alcohol phosphatidyltransferase family protein [Desulfonatronovibrio hydrogenovorans]|uniref:CDP-alcohol phosphatidyltransferase family protein n=1 Tax=Desulfonatronovibrio hydrogenovorans TaxID=53245 RepID=UPI00068C2C73|nr:CDP-alcohol phosphatidyltransferase family protein [Desulfonatronovibrio hydrogenovorans]